MSERFYINCPLEPGPVELDGPEAHHLSAVCRLRPGDEVCLFNGDGAEYPAVVILAAKKHVSLDVRERRPTNRERSSPLEVAAPLPKGDRAQFLIEKLTELGVTAFVSLICERSVVQPKESTLEKLERYVIEASKQCRRNVLMRIEPAATWHDYITTGPPGCFAHPGGGDHATAGRFAVGPEGGLTDAEVALALERGWRSVDLGPRILRVETAAIMGAAFGNR